jgi:hypothetical protein
MFKEEHMTLNTYAAGVQNLSGIAGDNLMITGSATTTVRVKRISISSSANAAQTINVNVIKRSSLDTGGTSTTLASVPYDSIDFPAGAVVKSFTATPAPGNQVGSLMRAAQIFINTAGGTPGITVFEFGDDIAQCVILRGSSECLCLNLGSAPTNTPNIGIDIEWTESPPNGL